APPPSTSAYDAHTQPLDGPSGTPEAVPAVTPSTGSRRNLWLAIAASLILATLFVVGILLSQGSGQSRPPEVTPVTAPTSTATASLPAGFLMKTDASDLYSFDVPSDWVPKPPTSASPNVEYTIYTDPLNDATFEVESFPTHLQGAGATLDEQFLLRISALSAGDISQPASVMLAGETWIKESAQLPLTQNGATQVQNLSVQSAAYNGMTFIIFYNSPDAGTGSQEGDVLQQILNTFNFLG
ncbi:MAG: hypothetical protein ACLQUY_24210, partial [Ktedonobacterales bacterium]